jgi:hypothetical protein
MNRIDSAVERVPAFSGVLLRRAFFFLVVMLINLFDAHELDCSLSADDVNRPIRSIEPHRPLPTTIAVERLVVETRYTPDFFESDLADKLDPPKQLVSDMERNPANLLLSPRREKYFSNHDGSSLPQLNVLDYEYISQGLFNGGLADLARTFRAV